MRWGDFRRSENVEDRTGGSPEGSGGGGMPFGGMRIGGGTLLILVIVGMLFGINPFEMLGMLGGAWRTGPGATAANGAAGLRSANERDTWPAIRFVACRRQQGILGARPR
jgi:uncharacterized protein